MSADSQSHVAVVTGGSKGIGRAIALTLAQHGYKVAILDPLNSGLGVVDEMEALGSTGMYIDADVSDEDSVLKSVQSVEESLGIPTVLVNNAGIYPRAKALDIPLDLWHRVMSVNAGGTFVCSRAFAPGMLKQGNGVIVNISSILALQPSLEGCHYAASKGAIWSLTKALAREWSPTIRVNAVLPGITDTDQPREGVNSDEELYAKGNHIPLGRIAQPEEIARVVYFLISSESSYMTGQCVQVEGGLLL